MKDHYPKLNSRWQAKGASNTKEVLKYYIEDSKDWLVYYQINNQGKQECGAMLVDDFIEKHELKIAPSWKGFYAKLNSAQVRKINTEPFIRTPLPQLPLD